MIPGASCGSVIVVFVTETRTHPDIIKMEDWFSAADHTPRITWLIRPIRPHIAAASKAKLELELELEQA